MCYVMLGCVSKASRPTLVDTQAQSVNGWVTIVAKWLQNNIRVGSRNFCFLTQFFQSAERTKSSKIFKKSTKNYSSNFKILHEYCTHLDLNNNYSKMR